MSGSVDSRSNVVEIERCQGSMMCRSEQTFCGRRGFLPCHNCRQLQAVGVVVQERGTKHKPAEMQFCSVWQVAQFCWAAAVLGPAVLLIQSPLCSLHRIIPILLRSESKPSNVCLRLGSQAPAISLWPICAADHQQQSAQNITRHPWHQQQECRTAFSRRPAALASPVLHLGVTPCRSRSVQGCSPPPPHGATRRPAQRQRHVWRHIRQRQQQQQRHP